ncbi:prepilin-type N-terminal cleavage/methylation domain-containing protein [Neisseriaceae bacterium ESL0693]|nr:prepilin-type N-terminal cleavage/methylation domain-containing protein [Neisseriaceae bacterium ESL0693]
MLKNNYHRFILPRQHGFTLIELMIAVAIIGLLAVFAVPQYQRYIMKAQLNRAYYELRASTTAIDTVLAFGHMPTLDKNQNNQTINSITYEYVGLDDQRATSDLLSHATLQTEDAYFRSISAQLNGHVTPDLAGTSLTLTRSNNGYWTCQITPPADNTSPIDIYAVGDCSLNAP